MEKNEIPDIYWGEFPEAELDTAIDLLKAGDYAGARKHLRDLGREGFIFGKERTDFMYYLPLNKNARVLDVGCGLGAHTFTIAPYVAHVEAFDQSKKRVEFCSLRAQAEGVTNVHFSHTDLEHADFPPASFDAILMNGVVEWLGEAHHHDNPRDDQVAVLKKLRGLLAPGGRLYVGIENRWAFAYFKDGIDHSGYRYTSLMPRWLATAYLWLCERRTYRTYTYGKRGYEKLLADAGFSVGKLDFYLAHPGYNLPKYIIPFNDTGALAFFLGSIKSGNGLKARIARFIAGSPFLLRLVRHSFYSFAIYADV